MTMLGLLERLVDRLAELVDILLCELEKHQGINSSMLLEQEEIELYGGPRDGEAMPYSGLIIRLAAHQDGAYCFDGELYKWVSPRSQ